VIDDPRPLVLNVVYRFDVGGLENGIVNLVNRLPSARFRHVVVALTSCSPDFCRRVATADVSFVSLGKGPGHGAWLYPRLFRLFREYRPAIVHTRNLAALEAVVPAWLAGVPVRIHGEHGWDLGDPEGLGRKNRLLRRMYRPFVTHYVALSAHLEDYLSRGVGVPASRVARICNGVDTVRFRPAQGARERLAAASFDDADAIVVGTVGRLQAVKDHRNLVDAFARLARRPEDWSRRMRLVIAGDGPLRRELATAIESAGIGDRVWMAGERSDVAALMRGFDLFVLPSRAEGISNTILEAMASGLPVVATDVGGNGELVSEGSTGRLVPAADPDALADAIACYAADADARREHGTNARRRCEDAFSLEHMVTGYAELYQSLLNGAGHALPAAPQH